MSEPLSYQKLLDIIKGLPPQQAEYILRFITNNENKLQTLRAHLEMETNEYIRARAEQRSKAAQLDQERASVAQQVSKLEEERALLERRLVNMARKVHAFRAELEGRPYLGRGKLDRLREIAGVLRGIALGTYEVSPGLSDELNKLNSLLAQALNGNHHGDASSMGGPSHVEGGSTERGDYQGGACRARLRQGQGGFHTCVP